MRLPSTAIVPLHLATVTFPEFHPLAGQRGDVMGYAVRHPDGVLLFDTGVGMGNDNIDRWYRPEIRPLGEHGIAVAEITAVACSHLHFDHSGGNSLFPGVPIHVQRAEREAARGPRYTIPEWVEFQGARYIEHAGDVEILPGVQILSTPGHTPGHQSLLVETEDGPVILAGQAVYDAAEWEHIHATGALTGDDPPPDPAAYLASALRLVALDPVYVHFGHDRQVWERKA